MQWHELFQKEDDPSLEQIDEFINNPLWNEINESLQDRYKIKPKLDYSCCSMQKGWNIKYKKSGKALCTLYPMQGYFLALLCITEKQFSDANKILPKCSKYTQGLYNKTETFMGGKWLMMKIDNNKVLEDALALMALKVPVK